MRLPVIAAAALLSVTSAFAADSNAPPLSPGKPAGIEKAQGTDSTLWWVVGGAALIAIVVVAASSGGSSNNNNNNGASSAGSTATP
jgi:hypothetical protein